MASGRVRPQARLVQPAADGRRAALGPRKVEEQTPGAAGSTHQEDPNHPDQPVQVRGAAAQDEERDHQQPRPLTIPIPRRT